MIKMILTDLDHTLLHQDGSISEETLGVLSECRKRGIEKLKVVYSEEEAMKPEVSSEEVLPPGKKSVPGSISFVPSAAGLIIAGEVIKDLINR